MAENHFNASQTCGNANAVNLISRCDHCMRISSFYHARNALFISLTPTDIHAVWHWAWDKTCILAGEKSFDEFWPGFGNNGHAVKPLQTSGHQLASQHQRTFAQITIR